jgi:glycosyltransferase involved in cell wall biosynthesis
VVSPSAKPHTLMIGNFLSEATGVRFVCEDLSAGLRSRGWSVTSASHLKNRGLRFADMLATVWTKRARYAVAQVDVYSGPSFTWAEAVAASLKALRCPFALTLHGGRLPDFARRHPTRVRRLLQSASVVTSPSPYLQRALEEYRPDIRVIPNGLCSASYPARHLMSARPRLVWVRAFHTIYNPLLAVEVVRLLSADFPDIELLMVGADRGDGSREQTLQRVSVLSLKRRVRILGPVPKDQVPQMMEQGDIFLNTTNVDNTPVTVVEAMASGLCVVSTNAGGIPYLLADRRNGLLVPCGDAQAMATAVREVLLDPALAARLSRNALRDAKTFAWDRVLPQWEGILRALAASHP